MPTKKELERIKNNWQESAEFFFIENKQLQNRIERAIAYVKGRDEHVEYVSATVLLAILEGKNKPEGA